MLERLVGIFLTIPLYLSLSVSPIFYIGKCNLSRHNPSRFKAGISSLDLFALSEWILNFKEFNLPEYGFGVLNL
jgi:hypothetical protein